MSGTWWEYVERIAENRSQKEISQAAGIEQSVVSRWKRGVNAPKAENVIAFARAFDRSPVEALIAAGYLEPDEAQGEVHIAPSVDDLTDEQLLAFMQRRFEEAAQFRAAARRAGRRQAESVTRAADRVRTNVRRILPRDTDPAPTQQDYDLAAPRKIDPKHIGTNDEP